MDIIRAHVRAHAPGSTEINDVARALPRATTIHVLSRHGASRKGRLRVANIERWHGSRRVVAQTHPRDGNVQMMRSTNLSRMNTQAAAVTRNVGLVMTSPFPPT